MGHWIVIFLRGRRQWLWEKCTTAGRCNVQLFYWCCYLNHLRLWGTKTSSIKIPQTRYSKTITNHSCELYWQLFSSIVAGMLGWKQTAFFCRSHCVSVKTNNILWKTWHNIVSCPVKFVTWMVVLFWSSCLTAASKPVGIRVNDVHQEESVAFNVQLQKSSH